MKELSPSLASKKTVKTVSRVYMYNEDAADHSPHGLGQPGDDDLRDIRWQPKHILERRGRYDGSAHSINIRGRKL